MPAGLWAAAVVLSCILAAVAFAAAGKDDEQLVRVNDHTITRGELDRFVRVSQAAAREALGSDAVAAAELDALSARQKGQALEVLVDRRLLVDRARRQYVANEAVEKSLRALADQAFQRLQDRLGSRLKAADWLSARGLTAEQFKDLQAEDILIHTFVTDAVNRAVSVAPLEVRQQYEAHSEEFRTPRTAVYRQIFFPVVEGAEEPAVQASAEAVLEQIRAGEDFAKAADAHSADGADYPGGLRTVAVPDDRPDWLPPAVQGLEPGQVSEVRRAEGGFSIARLERVVPTGTKTFAEVQGDIQTKLLAEKRRAALDDCLDRLRREAKIEPYPAAAEFGF
jgi:parvulin-like peptidyl-prolyl isomerase